MANHEIDHTISKGHDSAHDKATYRSHIQQNDSNSPVHNFIFSLTWLSFSLFSPQNNNYDGANYDPHRTGENPGTSVSQLIALGF